MKALIQRVSHANVVIDNKVVGEIDHGLLVLLGIESGDTEKNADKITHKLANYRVFDDKDGKMNCSVCDVNGGILLVSQFTLAAETSKGLRPGFSRAATPQLADQLYNYCITQLKHQVANVATGIFGADMQVSLTNDGPVTFLLEA